MIDLQEKMEKEKKINKYIEIDINSDDDKKSKVFSTDIINSLLNATNKEGMEILFDVKKDNINEEEKNFKKGVNQILEKINDCQNSKKSILKKKDIFVSINSIYSENNKNGRIKNKIFKSIKSNNKENISQLSNQKKSKKKTINVNANKITMNKKIKELNNNEMIIRNKLNINNNNNEKSKNKYNNKILNEKALIEKLEKELFKIRKKIKNNRNYRSQNISISMQSKKDLSLSKKNNSIFSNNNYNKNPSSSLSNINIFSIANYPSARGRSTKISSSNSFINDMKKKSFQKSRILQGSSEIIIHKKINSKIHFLPYNNQK
jgi:hypothetical protein